MLSCPLWAWFSDFCMAGLYPVTPRGPRTVIPTPLGSLLLPHPGARYSPWHSEPLWAAAAPPELELHPELLEHCGQGLQIPGTPTQQPALPPRPCSAPALSPSH